ncbi:MAG: Rpn family recombination-promoting nuclease/putative transposase [Chitinophagaceae bacterium]|nr:MAG: Rpn family recombination-promoting nuclease/putative transposase [Chitinophagaceae bacterium]
MVYYSTFPIKEQAQKGSGWNFELQAIYCIGILDFTFDDHEPEPQRSEVVHTVKLKNQNDQVFYDKLTFIYLEMPNFNKTEQELNSRLDQWLYFLKNLEDTTHIPNIFKDSIFVKAFDTAALATLSHEDYLNYEINLNSYRDLKNSLDTAFDDGKAEGKTEGKIEGKIEIAQKAKLMGLSNEDIAHLTGLPITEIEQL